MILKTMNRYYLPENVLLHQKMMVDRRIEDLTDFGENVIRTCKDAENYLLKKRHLIGENHNSKRVERKFDWLLNCKFLS
jgi:hypothetical protein